MKIIDYFMAKPARFFFLSAIVWFCLMCVLNSIDGRYFAWHDILVEANGMTFDLLVFGILLSAYEALRDKKDKIERLHEEIDDYRGWDEKEAMFRIEGAVKRLIRLGIPLSQINLNSCFVSKEIVKNIVVQKISFNNLIIKDIHMAHLQGARLECADLQGADLRGADLRGADLREANLQGADLEGANLFAARLRGANLQAADLQRVDLRGADLQGVVLEGQIFEGQTFKGDLSESIGLKK